MGPKKDEILHVDKTKLRHVIRIVLEQYSKIQNNKKKKERQEIAKEKDEEREDDDFRTFHCDFRDDTRVNDRSYRVAVIGSIRTLTTTHRWKDSLQIIHCLMNEARSIPLAIWKLGILILTNNDPENTVTSNFIKNFANKMNQFSRIYHHEILLDYVTYLMQIGDIYEAKRFVEDNIFRKVNKKQLPCITAAYRGYRAVLEYIQWTNKRSMLDGSQGVAGNQQIVMHLEVEVDLHFQRAIDFFVEALRCKGNFDFFVRTCVTLLESTQKFEMAEEVLKNYMKTNRRHPSAYDYYYEFLRSQSSTDTHLQIVLLKKLLKRNPADSRLFTLVDLMPNEAFVNRIKLLLNAVDHVDFRNDAELWMKLALLLTNEAQCISECHHRFLKSIWKDRKSWWPFYHFKMENVTMESTESIQLNVAKALVIATFAYPGHSFVEFVNNELKKNVIKEDCNKLDDAIEIVKVLKLKECTKGSNCTEKLKKKKTKKKMPTKKSKKKKSTKKSKTKKLMEKSKKKTKTNKQKKKIVSSSSPTNFEDESGTEEHDNEPGCSWNLRPRTRTDSYQPRHETTSSDEDEVCSSSSSYMPDSDKSNTFVVIDSTDSSSSKDFVSKMNKPSTSYGTKRKVFTKKTKSRNKNDVASPSSKVIQHRSKTRVPITVDKDTIWVEKDLLQTPISGINRSDAVVCLKDINAEVRLADSRRRRRRKK